MGVRLRLVNEGGIALIVALLLVHTLHKIRRVSMWQVPKAMPAPLPATGITPVASGWNTQKVRLSNQTTRKYRVHVSRTVDEVENSSFDEEGYADVEAYSEEEARAIARQMLNDHEDMGWEMVGDRHYGDSEITNAYDVKIDNVEEV
jgi:hypothetical protein